MRIEKSFFFTQDIIDENPADSTPRTVVDMDTSSQRLAPISCRAEINQIVDRPFRKACRVLYDKNIRCLSVSMNPAEGNVAGYASIIISWEKLSPENHEILRVLIGYFHAIFEYDGEMAAELRFPGGSIDKPEDIGSEMYDICNTFVSQEPSFDTWKIEDLQKAISPGVDEDYMVNEMGFVYDRREKLLYLSLEQWQKMHLGETYDDNRLQYCRK